MLYGVGMTSVDELSAIYENHGDSFRVSRMKFYTRLAAIFVVFFSVLMAGWVAQVYVSGELEKVRIAAKLVERNCRI